MNVNITWHYITAAMSKLEIEDDIMFKISVRGLRQQKGVLCISNTHHFQDKSSV